MLDQLKELLEMQRVLDDAILKEHGKVYDETIAEQNKIALVVELGEMMNELPTKFKHWKSTAKDNREKALVEYVDALHFALSLFNHYGCPIKTMAHTYKTKIIEHSIYLDDIPLDWEIPKFKQKLTDNEKVILKCLTGYYQYIARDECGTLYVYKRRPEKKIIDGMLSQFLILKMAMY